MKRVAIIIRYCTSFGLHFAISWYRVYCIARLRLITSNTATSSPFLQLAGSKGQNSAQAKDCEPLNKLGDIRLNPCGLIANTFFNDVISLSEGAPSSDGGKDLIMLEEGIAWESDILYLFAQPYGFKSELCPDQPAQGFLCENDTTCCDGDEWSCETPARSMKDNQCYAYFYPDESTTQYLYETYPQIISPVDGVMNEHFIVWMRLAALPTFRKLYAWINQPIANGTILTFNIENNWEVGNFQGRKSLVMTTTNIFGGKNNWMGLYFYATGFFCLGAAVFFALKQMIRPRHLADKRYLQFKQD